MLRIRKQDKGAFSQAQLSAFEDRVVVTLMQNYREACEARGEAEVRSFVQVFLPIVSSWGISREQEVAHGLNVAFAIVVDFGRDPEHTPWLRAVVDDPKLTATGKVHRLYVGLYAAYDAAEAARS